MIESEVEYIIETRIKGREWVLSDYSLNEFDKSSFDKARRLIEEARNAHQSTRLKFSTVLPREYRLIKATTTFEVLND